MENVCTNDKMATHTNEKSRQGGRQHNNNNRRNDRDRNDKDRNDRKNASRQERPKREAILDLSKYRDDKVTVKFIGGRQIVGVLKGYDQLMNLVLENVTETLRDDDDDEILTDKTRELGTVVVRGPQLLTLSPLNGTESIENPFAVEQ